MFVKTAHRDFPKEIFGEISLKQGEWMAFATTKDDMKLQLGFLCVVYRKTSFLLLQGLHSDFNTILSGHKLW